jgi:PAS domain S-box-containing protein
VERGFDEFEVVFDAAPDGIVVVDAEGVIREINPAALAMLGHDRTELLGAPVERIIPTGTRDRHVGLRVGYMEHPTARAMGLGRELEALRADGRRLPVEVSLSPCSTPRGTFVIAIMRDISERRRLRNLGVGTLRAAEEERARIARELHDDTAQLLAALLVRLRVLGRTDDVARRGVLIDEMHEELQALVEGVRRIARGLRPPALEDVGVEAAIRAHVRRTFEGGATKVELSLEPVDAHLSPEGQLVAYRVVQEAVTNAFRHSGAARIRVTLGVEEGQVVARVEDDGRGFDAEERMLEGRGLGLLGMDERARIAGGVFAVRSVPGGGCVVELRIPPAAPAVLDTAPGEEAHHGR